MRISAAILVMALMWIGPARAVEKPAPVYQVQATGTIEIGPQGNVSGYTLDKGQPAAIENALGRSIEQWRFEPILVDGKPVIAKTSMRLSLEAVPTPGEDYQLRLRGVWFGAPGRSPHHLKAPRYPEAAVRAGIGAKAVMVLQLDAQGVVQQVHTEQVSLDQGPSDGLEVQRWRDMIARSSISAAKKWKFDINETVAGAPIGTSVRVPIEFSLGRPIGANTWRSYIPGPRIPAPWIRKRSVASQDMDELKDGDVRSLASNFKLKDEVVGKFL